MSVSLPRDYDYLTRMNEIRSIQNHRNEEYAAENERRKEALRKRNIAYCQRVNHQRLIESSDELRHLKFATNEIAAGKINLQQRQAKEREQLTDRLADIADAVKLREKDDADKNKDLQARRRRVHQQHLLATEYDRHIQERVDQKLAEFRSWQEEKEHTKRFAESEARRKEDEEKRRQLSRKQWQETIVAHKQQMQIAEEERARSRKEEEDKIKEFEKKKSDEGAEQKAKRNAREAQLQKIRAQLGAQLEQKAKQEEERRIVEEELMIAEAREAEHALRKANEERKMNQRNILMKAAELSNASRAAQRAKELQNSRDYEEMIREKDAKDLRNEKEEKQRIVDMNQAMRRELDAQMEAKRLAEEQQEALNREDVERVKQNEEVWKAFVASERESYLKGKYEEVQDFVRGYRRFPRAKDQDAFDNLLSGSSNGANTSEAQLAKRHHLASISAPHKSPMEVYKNMLHARLYDIHSLGTR